ncbi:hypothetical protein [Streptomyces sp. NPDC058613]|uniref:hypothetical protein n=1 Tax=unclassified Streptomyces TaxID=2593676 RepID=UPI00365CB4C3
MTVLEDLPRQPCPVAPVEGKTTTAPPAGYRHDDQHEHRPAHAAGRPSRFAMYEAALVRRRLTDAERHELLEGRPYPAAARTARERSL